MYKKPCIHVSILRVHVYLFTICTYITYITWVASLTLVSRFAALAGARLYVTVLTVHVWTGNGTFRPIISGIRTTFDNKRFSIFQSEKKQLFFNGGWGKNRFCLCYNVKLRLQAYLKWRCLKYKSTYYLFNKRLPMSVEILYVLIVTWIYLVLNFKNTIFVCLSTFLM